MNLVNVYATNIQIYAFFRTFSDEKPQKRQK